MIEMQDANGRLIVVLPMRMRHHGRIYCVFREGKCDAEFRTFREAVNHAKALVESGVSDPPAGPREGDPER